MKLSHAVLTVFAAVIATLVIQKALPVSSAASNALAEKQESAYDRVMRTGTVRCGYLIYPKFFEKDPNTGKFSGISYDVFEEIGKQLSLKIEWTEEVGMSEALTSLSSQRFDVFCLPLAQTPGRAREAEFTLPTFFVPFFAYSRTNDTRFDNNYSKVNDPSVRYAYVEGEFSQSLRNDRFPKTQSVSMPSITPVSQLYMQVATGKADIVTTEPSSIEGYMKNNPGQLKRVEGDPIRVMGGAITVGKGEEKLKALINTTVSALLESGYIENTMSKYITSEKEFFLPAKPWGEAVPVGVERK